jgi:hypothetical protein
MRFPHLAAMTAAACLPNKTGRWLYHRPVFLPDAPQVISRATADGTAVHALVAGAAADHDGTAIGTRRRILLIEAGDTADTRHRRSASRCLADDRYDFLRNRDLFRFLSDDADLPLGLAVEKLGGQPPENIIHNRLGHRNIGILGKAGRFEAHMAKLVDQPP